MEDTLIELPTMRRFASIVLIGLRIAEETSIFVFGHLVEKQNLGKRIFLALKANLKVNGVAMKKGTIIEATLVAASSSTKYNDGVR
jgi:IS5 family transposase